MRLQQSRARLALVALLVAMATPSGASNVGVSALDGDAARVRAKLLAVERADVEGEASAKLGLLLEIDPGWHVYWKNPGAMGLATEVEWELDGATLSDTRWPAPVRFGEDDPEGASFGYAGRTLLWADASYSRDGDAPRVARVHAELLACRDQCIPARFELESPIAPQDHATLSQFEAFEARLPVTPAVAGVALETRYSQSAIRPGDAFEAALIARDCPEKGSCVAPTRLEFFPDAYDGLSFEILDQRADPSRGDARLVLLRGRAAAETPANESQLRGVLALSRPSGQTAYLEVDLPLPRAAAGESVAAHGEAWLSASRPTTDIEDLGLVRALALGLLGGLILNLMPCVLPVLAIKLFSIAELAQRSRVEVLAHAGAYTAGILASLSLLAGVVLGLRTAGTSVGWGFQFQEPAFLAVVSAVLVVFALNLMGVFEISAGATGRLAELGQQVAGTRRSLLEGLLAVVLATPCSAPFLGTAVGFAFASSPAVILGVFWSIGMGLAAPYVLVSLVPGWARYMPRSGAWMLKLRSGLGFALLGSVVWLLWVLGRVAGMDTLAGVMAALVGLAFVAWLYGQAQAEGRAMLRTAAGVGLVMLALGGVGLVRVQPSTTTEPSHQVLAFDPASLSAELASGRPAFVYFTADWCITCAVNERSVLSDARVRAALERGDVAVFEADWTQRDEQIRAELARFGRAGVPLYLLYSPGAPGQPRVLPELLSVDLLLEAIDGTRASPSGDARHAERVTAADPART